MKTNWYGLTTLQHLSKMANLWFATPFTKYFWKTLLEGGDFNAGYVAFGVLFMGIGFPLLWATTPILFPIIFLVSRLYCYKKARKMVINALRSK